MYKRQAHVCRQYSSVSGLPQSVVGTALKINSPFWSRDVYKRQILDAPYFHVVFTVPEELNPIIYSNQKFLYTALYPVSYTHLESGIIPKKLPMPMEGSSIFPLENPIFSNVSYILSLIHI